MGEDRANMGCAGSDDNKHNQNQQSKDIQAIAAALQANPDDGAKHKSKMDKLWQHYDKNKDEVLNLDEFKDLLKDVVGALILHAEKNWTKTREQVEKDIKDESLVSAKELNEKYLEKHTKLHDKFITNMKAFQADISKESKKDLVEKV